MSVSLDALPAALQSPGEAAPAEVVHGDDGSGKEKDHQGNDHHCVGTATTFLQLPAVERPEDHLQEVTHSPGVCLFAEAFRLLRLNLDCIFFMHLLSLRTLSSSFRYASLYFCLAVENQENELLALETIHRYVELLDKYFGNVFQYY